MADLRRGDDPECRRGQPRTADSGEHRCLLRRGPAERSAATSQRDHVRGGQRDLRDVHWVLD